MTVEHIGTRQRGIHELHAKLDNEQAMGALLAFLPSGIAATIAPGRRSTLRGFSG